MILITNTEVYGFDPAIRGMRNPKNSWDRSDSNRDENNEFSVGDADLQLMKRLAAGGPVHAKYRRMIVVYADITAPLYWWKEFDTYKVGTVSDSCSTMHKIQAKEFVSSDFSIEHITGESIDCVITYMDFLNLNRKRYLDAEARLKVDKSLTEAERKHKLAQQKEAWWQMIQLLPSSYNQKRTIMMNYEVLANIYPSRKNHKLDEWHKFCDWIESLPHSEIITGIGNEFLKGEKE